VCTAFSYLNIISINWVKQINQQVYQRLMDPDTLFKEDLTFEMFLEKVYKLKDFDKQVHFTLLQAKKPMRCEQVNKKMKTDTVKVYRSLQKLTKAAWCCERLKENGPSCRKILTCSKLFHNIHNGTGQPFLRAVFFQH